MNEEELLKILNKEKSYTEEDLLLFIYDLRKQNTELKEENFKLQARSDRFINYWNKLKEWLEEGIQNPLSTWGEVYPKYTYENVLEYMQEIEGGMNDR